LKYGYAVTCHKAQGGEWDNTFVFWDYATNDSFDFKNSEHNRTGKTNPDFYRWAYTAITRASDKLFCINPPKFNSYINLTFIDAIVKQSYQELTGVSITPVEINLDQDLQNILVKLYLSNTSVSEQNHFIRLHHFSTQESIEIVKWERINYEIRYIFKRGNEVSPR